MSQYCFVYVEDESNWEALLELTKKQKIEWLNERYIKAIDTITLSKELELKPAFGYRQTFPVGHKFLVVEGDWVEYATKNRLYGKVFVKAHPDFVRGVEVVQHVKRIYLNKKDHFQSNGFSYPKIDEEYALVLQNPKLHFQFNISEQTQLLDIVKYEELSESMRERRFFKGAEHIPPDNRDRKSRRDGETFIFRYFENLEHVTKWIIENKIDVSAEVIKKGILDPLLLENLLFEQLLESNVGKREIINKRTLRVYRKDIFTMFDKIEKNLHSRNLFEQQYSHVEQKAISDYEKYRNLYDILLKTYVNKLFA